MGKSGALRKSGLDERACSEALEGRCGIGRCNGTHQEVSQGCRLLDLVHHANIYRDFSYIAETSAKEGPAIANRQHKGSNG
jgi:hypothetical protein